MTKTEWNQLLEILDGKQCSPLPMAFIIDSPWLPGWHGISIMDYYASDSHWLEANFNAIEAFPGLMFLPGFWSEFGMCTEPSAYGSKMVWDENNLPHADKTIHSIEQIDDVKKPNVEKDGLLPFMIKRLLLHQETIQKKGHAIKFAIARGPLNIASFLMGTTEFLIALKTDAEKMHKFLSLISDFTIDWIKYQIKSLPSIEGVLLLDDIVGFLGDGDFKEFVFPYLKSIYDRFDVPVKFFHNDAEGKVCAPYLSELGVNLFNFSHNHTLGEMRALVGEKVTLLGNIPPRDVLARGTGDDIKEALVSSLDSIDSKSRLILSCGGGMPPDVSTENLNSFIQAVKNLAE
ncbi:uroporphyrinogen decarboxylase [candidate division KSB1 bacterium]|nr:uroporphyrinogen decarboxylase [candidate division KSB1 bacterium]